MREQVLEMRQKLILFDEMQATDEEIKTAVGMSLDLYEKEADKQYEALPLEDKKWVDAKLYEWFKNYKQIFDNGCSMNCCCCGKHEV